MTTETVTLQTPVTAKNDLPSLDLVLILQQMAAAIDAASGGGGGGTNLGYTPATRILTSDTGTDVTLPLVGADAGFMTSADKTKIDGIATGATANSADATLLARANHTGTQLAASVSDFDAAVAATASVTANTAKISSEPVYIGVLAGNYTLTNTALVQKLFNWTANGALTLPTGVYVFECMAQIASMSATSGNGRFDLSGGGTATLGRIMQSSTGRDVATVGSLPTAQSGAMVAANVFTTNTVLAGVAVAMEVSVTGSFDVTVTGTIIPSILLTTAVAAIVQAGSRFRCQRIADTGAVTVGTWT